MPTCFIHVGGHKAGSSAIQGFLQDRRAELREAGLLVPESGAARIGTHGPLTGALRGLPMPSKLGDVRAALDAELKAHPSHDVIVSHEGLEFHFQTGAVSPVAAFFRERGYHLAILLYVRNQPQRLNSGYGQVTKAFQVNEEIEAYVGRALHTGALANPRWLGVAAHHDARLLARPFNDALKRTGVIPDLLDALGLNPGLAGETSYRSNEAVTAPAVAAARTVMDRLAERGVRLNQRQRGRANTLLQAAQGAGAGFRGLTQPVADSIQRHFAESNEQFARQVWGRAWSDLFAADLGERFNSNAVDRADPDAPGHAEYRRVLDAVWPEIEAVAARPGPAQPWWRHKQPPRDGTELARRYLGEAAEN